MRNVIITGASSGIGKSTTEVFLKNNWRVIMADKVENDELLECLNKEYEGKVFFKQTDVSNFNEIKALYDFTKEKFEKIDSIINNAGIIHHSYLHEASEQDWDSLFNTDVKSIFYMCKVFIVDMIKNQGGTIVNTASISGLRGDYKMPIYNAAKGAVVNLTRAMALDYAKFDIRVNSVCPSAIRTPLIKGDLEPHISVNPLKRVGEADEVAKVIYFLASEDSSFITGANIPVTGGLDSHTGQPVH